MKADKAAWRSVEERSGPPSLPLSLVQVIAGPPGPDGAVSLELDAASTIHPVVYLRRNGRVRDEELEPNLSRNYEGAAYSEAFELLLRPLLSETSEGRSPGPHCSWLA